MEINYIIGISSIIITLICGEIAKKIKWFNSNLIPIQNLLIGIIVTIIYYIMTKDFSLSISLSGIAAGGIYDLFANINKLKLGYNDTLKKFNKKEGVNKL